MAPEQSSFQAGKSTIDNILVVQEIVHSFESDTHNPPKMLLKVDIEMAYDALNWNAILATLTLMNFPTYWIAWIKACLTSSIFPLLSMVETLIGLLAKGG